MHRRDRIYHADMYAFGSPPTHYWTTSSPEPPLSFAPASGDIATDVAIIGGGYTGLAAAERCAAHGLSAAVFDAGCGIGWGASGANGGFVSMGGVKLDAAQMLRAYGELETRAYWQGQAEAVSELQATIARAQITCDPVGDGNACVAHSKRSAATLREEALLLQQLGADAAFIEAQPFAESFHRGPEAQGALVLRPGFGVQPFALVHGLARVASGAGARIYTSTRIIGWEKSGAAHQLVTDQGVRVRARSIILATNGYVVNALARPIAFCSIPAISHIIVTQAYDDASLVARGFVSQMPVYTARHLLSYYRRLPSGRLLFGCRGDVDGSDDSHRQHAAAALKELKRVLPDFADAQIDYSWRGLVSLTTRRTLAIGRDGDDASVAFAFGCHGSGTATMRYAGQVAADLILGRKAERDIPAMFRGLPAALPPSPRLLRRLLGAAYRYYAWRDARS